MNVEITRGRSDIYDILTHLFIFIESHKIRNRVLLDDSGEVSRDWIKLEHGFSKEETNFGRKAISHAANILGRRFEEVLDIYDAFGSAAAPDRFLHVIFWLGKLAIEEIVEDNKRTITFSPILRNVWDTIFTAKFGLPISILKKINFRPTNSRECKHAQCNEFYLCYRSFEN
jgi:hypothetical protein